MKLPTVGDIWQYTWDYDPPYYLLVIEVDDSLDTGMCINLKNGKIEPWGWQTPYQQYWEQLA